MRSTRVRRASLAAVASLLAVLPAACSSGGGSTGSAGTLEKTNVTVAAVPAEGAAALYLAQEKGLFAKQGLHVTIKTISASANVIPELLHGTIDVDSGGWNAIIAAQAAGLGTFHALANGFALGPHVHEILTLPSSHITTPAELKGKTIAVNALNTETTDFASTALAAYGITPSEVHYVAIPFPFMDAALAAHRVDAIYEVEPYVTESEVKLGALPLVDIDSGSLQNFPINGYMVTEQWYRRYPRTAAAFARAIDEGNALASTNLGDLQHVLETSLHIPAKIADTMAIGSFPTTVDPTQLQRVADLMQHFGQLKHPFNVKVLTQ